METEGDQVGDEKPKDKPVWIPLESNPAILTDYIHNVGVSKEWSFRDCFGLTEETLAFVPQPCYALLFLFPVGQLKAERQEEEQKILSEGQTVNEKVYFIKQHVKNACGTIAVVHALANNKEALKIESGALHEFLEKTRQNTPEERGHLLGKDQNMTKYHHQYSKLGSTNPKDFAKSDFHFICFTNVNGHLYELDGSKKFPINHGPTSQHRMLMDAANVIQKNFTEKNPTELFFSLITLGPAQGDELNPQELMKPRELLDEEVDQGKAMEMVGMGFSYEQAVVALKKRNNKTQQAIEYILSHPREPSAPSTFPAVDESLVEGLIAMGFSREISIQALMNNNNSFERAVDFLLSG